MGCGVIFKSKKINTVLVNIMPSSDPVVAMEPEDSDEEEDGAKLEASQAGKRDLADMMVEVAPDDHFYLKKMPVRLQPVWMKRVEREWRILARGLPATIHIQLYEDRMDLMRAAIVGPKHTPYADALFFFDIYLSPDYPHVPPSIAFWAHGKRLNPNLYASGRICLSLLGTWSGAGSENWRPQESNVLQVLVSILGLVLVEDPYFNEPGFEGHKGKKESDLIARRYNETVRITVLESMLVPPPKGFREIATKHYEECGASVVKRVEWLALQKPQGCSTRIDGIDFHKHAPSEGFKRQLMNVLPRLKEIFPESDDSLDGDLDSLAVLIPNKPKLAWMRRSALSLSKAGGG